MPANQRFEGFLVAGHAELVEQLPVRQIGSTRRTDHGCTIRERGLSTMQSLTATGFCRHPQYHPRATSDGTEISRISGGGLVDHRGT
jgi:hypothetical protein